MHTEKVRAASIVSSEAVSQDAHAKQVALSFGDRKIEKHFGGAYLKNSHAKTKRPITTQQPMHLVMRSSMATRRLSLLNAERAIRKLIYDQGQKLGVKIYRYANSGNHLHLVILPHSRRAFRQFIQAISGLIARKILGVERGSAKGLKFWDQRPFTRIIEWGREFRRVCAYLLQNTLEAWGFVTYRARKTRYLGLSTG